MSTMLLHDGDENSTQPPTSTPFFGTFWLRKLRIIVQLFRSSDTEADRFTLEVH